MRATLRKIIQIMSDPMNTDYAARVREYRVPHEYELPPGLVTMLTPANFHEQGWQMPQPQPATPSMIWARKMSPDNASVTYELWLDREGHTARAYRITTVVPPAADADDELAAAPPLRQFRVVCRVEEALSIF